MIRILPFCEGHIDEIAKIEHESFGDPWSRNLFVDLLDNPLAVCFTAVEVSFVGDGVPDVPQTPDGVAATPFQKGAVAGYLIAYYIVDEIQILNIAVKKSKQNRGIATELFQVIFEYAKNENAGKFTLEVRPSNAGAIELYKKLGFKIDGIRKNYYKNPKEDAVLMSLKI